MSPKTIVIGALSVKEKAYLIGIIIGDGYLYHDKWRHYKTNIYLNSKKDVDVAKSVIDILKKLGVSPYIMHHHGCLIIRFNSKSFFDFFNKESKSITNKKNKDFMIGFISGFIDSDGYVSYGNIVVSNVEKEIIDITNEFCKKLKISTRVWKHNNLYKGKVFNIWRLRIGTSFKYEKHYSQKINRIYGGALPIIASIHSEMGDTYKGGVARKSRRAHNP
jgi:DNA-binding transcriptional regulator WhiA